MQSDHTHSVGMAPLYFRIPFFLGGGMLFPPKVNGIMVKNGSTISCEKKKNESTKESAFLECIVFKYNVNSFIQ